MMIGFFPIRYVTYYKHSERLFFFDCDFSSFWKGGRQYKSQCWFPS